MIKNRHNPKHNGCNSGNSGVLTILGSSHNSGVRPAICDSQSAAKSFVKSHGYVGLEFKLRPFSAGSILTLRNRIEPPASTTSVELLLQNRDL